MPLDGAVQDVFPGVWEIAPRGIAGTHPSAVNELDPTSRGSSSGGGLDGYFMSDTVS
jgi:hypothetical protein